MNFRLVVRHWILNQATSLLTWINEGYLRKVTSASINGNTITLQTA